MILPSLLSIAVSATLIALLGRRDPKRLRSQHRVLGRTSLQRMPRGVRRFLGWLVLAPGVVLIFLGEWWAFLVWLGALCVAGWMASVMLAIHPVRSDAES